MINILIYQEFEEAKQWLKNKQIDLSNLNSNTEIFDFKLVSDLSIKLNQNNLFSVIDNIIITNAIFLSDAECFKQNKILIDTLSTISQKINIFILVAKKVLANAEIKNFFEKTKIHKMSQITENNKIAIIEQLLTDYNFSLPTNIRKALIAKVNCNYANISNELHKLMLLEDSDLSENEKINNISLHYEENIFQLFESILLKQTTKVWSIYTDLMVRKQDEISIMAAMSSQATTLFFCLKLLKNNVTFTEISKILGISNYMITIYKNKFISYNSDKLYKVIEKLYNLESDIKMSKVDKRIAFKESLFDLLRI